MDTQHFHIDSVKAALEKRSNLENPQSVEARASLFIIAQQEQLQKSIDNFKQAMVGDKDEFGRPSFKKMLENTMKKQADLEAQVRRLQLAFASLVGGAAVLKWFLK